jgi:general nucleoside transport system permease protein
MERMSAVDTAPAPSPPARPLQGPAERRQRTRLTVIFGLAALLLLLMRVKTAAGDVVFAASSPFDENQLPEVHLPAALVVTICLIVAVLATGLQAFGLLKGTVRGLVIALVAVGFVVGFLCWVYSGQDLPMTNPLPGTLKYATPLILGALSGALCERSGVINVAIEGQFLAGAFAASVIGTMTYSPYLGMLGGIGAGILIAALLAVFAIRYLVNQVILGVVLVVFAGGITGFLLDQIPDSKTLDLNSPPILEPKAVPGLSAIPVIGPAFFEQTWLVYIMYISVILVTFILFETRWGLRVRAVGEHPTAADTVGIKVKRMRYQAVLFGGVFAGLGGAFFTVGTTGAFDKDASGGTGFIALAALIMGRWHPVGATLAALFFGFASQLQNQLQILQKIPSELLGMTPYIATVIAVAGFVGRVRPPAADGEPYVKG